MQHNVTMFNQLFCFFFFTEAFFNMQKVNISQPKYKVFEAIIRFMNL